MINLLTRRNDTDFFEHSTQLAQDLDALSVKVTKLQQENHYLRRSNRVRPHLRIVIRAEAAAHLLAMWHCAGYLTGRASAFVFGMSQDTFYAGRALCILANLHDGQRWLTDDPATIQRRLGEATEYAKRRPDALIAHIPLSRQPKSFNA